MGIDVRPVATRSERRAFLRLPWKIYPGKYPAWVPPLISEEKKRIDPAKNPFFEHGEVELYLAYRNGEPVGRIAAVENRLHNEFHKDNIGFFGLFESVDDQEVADALFAAAEGWVRERGLTGIRGPANFSTNDECGLLLDNFDDPPSILMTFNPPYYERLIESCGYEKAKDLLAHIAISQELDARRMKRIKRIAERSKHSMRIRHLDMKHFNEEVGLVRDLYNSAWELNWGFVPMTDAEVEHMAKALKPIVVPELVLFAEIDGETAGFALALPDVNQALRHLNGRLFPFGIVKLLWYMRKIDRVRIVTLGLKKEFRGSGIDGLLYMALDDAADAHGMPRGESSWILEDNAMMVRALAKMGFEAYKTYRLYERRFDAGV